MFYKTLIGTLLACTLTACSDNAAPIVKTDDILTSGGFILAYICRGKTEADSLADVEANLEISVRVKSKTSQTQPDFIMPRGHIKGIAAYQADIIYYMYQPDPVRQGNFVRHNIFEYNNIDFDYDNQDLILKVPQDDNLPTCEMRFIKNNESSSLIGTHKCKFEKNDVGYRAVTFNVLCANVGKLGVFTEPDL